MIRFECDRCGALLAPNDAQRFIVRIEAFAAAGSIELAQDDADRDRSEQITRLIESLNNADPDQIEDQTYRSMRFDLCATCHRAYLASPLG
ncbi:MAG: hypothetical protein V3W34_16060 [Phycisphaerae bacterium]